jgi:hypothetical protein
MPLTLRTIKWLVRFWNDPSSMQRSDKNQIERVKYMTGQIIKNASSLNAGIEYQRGAISLYMTGWKGVNDYQCLEFMHDAFRWLLK